MYSKVMGIGLDTEMAELIFKLHTWLQENSFSWKLRETFPNVCPTKRKVKNLHPSYFMEFHSK